MSAQSGFLDCFLKFLKGEEGEKLPPPMRGGGRSRSSAADEIKKVERKPSANLNNTRVKEKKKLSSVIQTKGSEDSEEKQGESDAEKGGTNKKKDEKKKSEGEIEPDVEPPVKRKRGRPPKKKTVPSVKNDVKCEEIPKRPWRYKRLRSEGDSNEGYNHVMNESVAAATDVEATGQVADEKTVSESETLEEETVEDREEERVVTVGSEVKEGSSCETEAKNEVEGETIVEEMESKEESVTKDECGAETESVVKEDNQCTAESEVESKGEQNSVISNGVAINCTGKEGEKVHVNLSTVHRKKNKDKKGKKVDSEGETPRRRLSARKAKQKPNISYAESGSEEDLTGLNENSDSDDDPMWVPNEKKASSDEDSGFSWSKYEKLHLKSKWPSGNRHLPVSPNQKKEDNKTEHRNELNTEMKELKGNPVSDSGGANSKKNASEKRASLTSMKCSTVARGSDIPKSTVSAHSGKTPSRPVGVVSPEERNCLLNPFTTIMPFQSGTFIAQKKDLEELEEPVIWRVDGKSLLQKYEPFRSDRGSIMYRNVSTYSGWGPKSQFEYQQVPVKFIQQTKVETIVKIIHEELVINEEKLIEKLAKDYKKHMYSYEVYLQTLISQALDTNFISEIIAEKDDYFLISVNELDKICEERKTKLLKSCQWTKKLMESLVTWPTMVVPSPEEILPKERCEVCSNVNDAIRIKMDGEPYKNATLEYSPPSEISFKCKDFYVCKKCSDCVMLYHKITHLKYHTYTEMLQIVAEKRALDPCKDNTSILHDILANGTAVQKKFNEISSMWAQADVKSRRLKANEDKHTITHN